VGTRGFHFENLNRTVNAFGGMVENEARVCDVGIDQFVLAAAKVNVTVVHLAILIHMVVQRQLGLAELLLIYQNVFGCESHSPVPSPRAL
jgi:hypothetical protein